MSSKVQKTLLIRLDPELHKKMRHISVESGMSLNQYVVLSFQQIVLKYNKEISNDESKPKR